MITFNQVTKRQKVNGRSREILSLATVEIPSNQHIALFTSSVEESNLVINLLAGIEPPTSGHIRRAANVSFPVGHAGGLQAELTLRHNSAHVARLYDADPSSVVDFMAGIAGLRDVLDVRFRDLPAALKRQFAQVLAYSIPFDTYLLNVEPTRVAADHRAIACALFEARTRTSGAIVAVRQPAFARTHCGMALCLLDGKLVLFSDVEAALAASRARAPEPSAKTLIHNAFDS